MKACNGSSASIAGAASEAGKVWNKVNPGTTDIHGNPILQKYATESEVITITAGSKRGRSYNAPPTLKYAKVYLERLHNHH